jgi:MoxR-like ATPase
MLGNPWCAGRCQPAAEEPIMTPAQIAALTALNDLRSQLEASVLERRDEIEALLTALLARQHVLLLGPPGTAKSMLGNLLAEAMEAKTFTRLLTKHSVPEELFGPYSLAGLEQDRYERKIDGYLPTAQIAVLDEIFKANSAILNALLTLLNERAFDNGTARLRCPLEIALGMSNEIPQDDGLGALYDRFTVRRWVAYLSDEDHFRSMLTASAKPLTARLTAQHLGALRIMVDEVKVTSEVLDGMVAIRRELAQKGIQPSDRRYRSALALVKAQAVLRGSLEASTDDLFILRDCLWDRPEDRQEVASIVLAKASPELGEAVRLRDAAIEIFQRIDLGKVETGPAIKSRRELAGVLEGIRNLRQTPKIIAIALEVEGMDTEIKRAVSKAIGL